MTKARSNATANAAKGDLTVGNGTNLSGVLAVGSNGDTIVADSSTSTGLRYQAAPSINYVIGGGFDIWQRGTSFASAASAIYTADRFQLLRSGGATGATVTRQASGNTSFEYAARVQRDSGNTSTAVVFLGSSFESSQSIPLAGQTVVFSFWARKGANYSQAASNVDAVLTSGTGTNQNVFNGLTGQATVATVQPTLTTSWQRFSVSGTVGSTATQLAIYFNYTPAGTAGAADYFEVSGIKLELGSVPTAFSRAGGTIQGELAACQRYFQYYKGGIGLPYPAFTSGTTLVYGSIQMPIIMRSAPSVSLGGTLYFFNSAAEFGIASPTIDYSNLFVGGGRLRIGGATGLTSGLLTTAYSGDYGFISLSSEL